MKTKDLIKKVNVVKGLAAFDEGHRVTFYEIGQDFPFYTMDKKNVDFGQGDSNFANLRDTNMSRLSYVIDAIREYLETPLAEREEEKRYRLRIVANLGFMDDQRFLNLNIEREEYFICSARQSEWVKTIFTESEISQMDTTGFEKIRVME